MKKLLALIFGLLLLSHCGKETVGPVTKTGITFNEIQSTGGDWLEIYNGTLATISLAGYKVYDDPLAKYTIASGSATSKGFFVLNCDGTGIGGNASFKLSAAGETVYLEDNTGKLIDQVTFPALTNRSSYAHFPDGDGDWSVTGDITKGLTNGIGHAPTISDAARTPLVPLITEVVTITVKVTDTDGVSSVKLFSRKDANAFTSTTMNLSAGVYSATIAAANATGNVEYYIEATNNKNVKSSYPSSAPVKTFSYLLNTDVLPQLFINEFMASNVACCPDMDGGIAEYNDWIEIYNNGNSAVNIANYYLTDSLNNRFKFQVANTDAAKTTIPAKGFLIITADEQNSQGILHASFQLNALGEQIGLYYFDGRKIDEYTFTAQTVDKSWARTTDGGTWGTLPVITPTKGGSN